MKMIRMVSGAVLLGVALNVDSGAAEPAASPASTDSGTASGPALSPYPGPVGEGDFVIGPTYTNAPELTVKEGVPQGTVHHFTMSSTDSKFYPGLPPRNSPPGTPIAPYTRDVWVYVPSQYAAGTPAPFIVAHDGKGYTNNLPRILDNMIADKRLPVMIGVMVHHGGGDGRGSERGLEYDTVSGKYAEFLESEVLPKISKDYNVVFTKDPDGRATLGGSSGGAVAFTMGWTHPEWYHRILTYSGTYVNNQSPFNPLSPQGAWMYHEYLLKAGRVQPLRVWLEVSENDNGAKTPEAGMHNWVIANQHMAQGLKTRGYHYRYIYALNAGHTDGKVTRQTLPEALLWLWEGYTAK